MWDVSTSGFVRLAPACCSSGSDAPAPGAIASGCREERQSASNTHGSPPPGIDQAEGDGNDARHVCCCVIPTATSLVCVRTNGRCRGMTEPTSFPSFSGCKCTVQITEKHVLVLKGINIILAGKISTHSVRVTPVRRVCAHGAQGTCLLCFCGTNK